MVGAPRAFAPGAEWTLIAVAVGVAALGMVVAFVRLDPAALKSPAQSAPATGFGSLLEHKYYIDEIYDRLIVRPVVAFSRWVLWTVIDKGIVDGLFVNGAAFFARALGWIGSKLQTGQTGEYAWALALGALVVLGAFALR